MNLAKRVGKRSALSERCSKLIPGQKLSLFLFLACSVSTISKVAEGKLISMGTQKQLFIDDFIIESLERVSKCFHQFKFHLSNPILVSEKPWELANFVYGTVLRDLESGLFRMWCTNSGSRP